MPTTHTELTRQALAMLRDLLEADRRVHISTVANGPPADAEPHLVEAFVTAGNMLSEIDTALAKLDRGGYGTCERCERAIPSVRLEALPHTRYCVKCAGAAPASRARVSPPG